MELITSPKQAPQDALVVSGEPPTWSVGNPTNLRTEVVERHTKTQIVTDLGRYRADGWAICGSGRRLYAATDDLLAEVKRIDQQQQVNAEARGMRAEIAELLKRRHTIGALRLVRDVLLADAAGAEQVRELQAVD